MVIVHILVMGIILITPHIIIHRVLLRTIVIQITTNHPTPTHKDAIRTATTDTQDQLLL